MGRPKEPSIHEKRLILLGCYDGAPAWKAKVSQMRPRQVYAVYKSFKENGYFEREAEEFRQQSKEEYRQLTLWDAEVFEYDNDSDV